MQDGLNGAMFRNTDSMGARLKLAREKRRLSQDELAARTGMKQSNISKIEKGGIGQTAGIARLALALQVDPAWLELGIGQEPAWDSVQEGKPAPWGGVRFSELSQTMRHVGATVVPTYTWGAIVNANLPKEFFVAAPDDAMSPRVKAGKLLRFATSVEPSPGDGVLIADRDGNAYFRLYRQRRAGTWPAVALNEAYHALDSEADGLRVLAVLVAEEGRWAG